MVVSSDLRDPAVEQLLGARASHGGLSQLLSDWETFGPTSGRGNGRSASGGTSRQDRAAFLMPTLVEGLLVIPAGPATENPAELLGSAAMSDMLLWLRDKADVVVLDSPPVLAVTDALVLSSHADAVLLVVASGRSSRGNVRRALALLERSPTPVLGYVLNRAPRSGAALYPNIRADRKLNGSPTSARHGVPAP